MNDARDAPRRDFVAVFDADGVFLRTTQPANFLENRYGLTPERSAAFYKAMVPCLTGDADMAALLPDFLREWKSPESVDEFLEGAFGSGTEIVPEVADVVADLRTQGVICCLATNQDKRRMAYLERMNLRTHFDAVFVSCEMGVKKPDLAFYEKVGERFAGRTLAFWDDRSENVIAANKSGWTSFEFTGVASLRGDLARLMTGRGRGS